MGKWIKRVLLGLLAVLAILVVVVVGWIVVDALFGTKTADVANVTYSDEAGNQLLGYLARPDEPGPHPAVLLVHEWWGLNEEHTAMADLLADEGYVVFAPDAYRGSVTAAVPRALWLRITTPEEEIFADMDAALSFLLGLEGVDSGRVAAMGFCFGGEQALQLGLRQPDPLAATVIYYGSLVTDPEQLRPLAGAAPVLGIFGDQDAQIPVAEVRAFEVALDGLGIPNQITVYPGVGHAFLNRDNVDQPGPTMDAWQETLAFLAENLKSN